jgi:hypothetical protein
MNTKRILGFVACAAIVTGYFYFSGNASAQKTDATVKDTRTASPENNTPQSLPFSQNWTNIGLITTNDDWSGVPGIQAFQGNDLTTATGTDPRTILADGSTTVLDVIANVANCDTNTSGGIAECEGAGGNPTIALQGSGTADVAHIVIYLNTTGQSNIRVQYNARDIDGSADNTNQQINTQYRVGNTGNFVNLPGGYIADASTGPSQATLVTPIDVILPPAANDQPLVEVRVTTTNAPGSDEWIGIDDINVTASAIPSRGRATVDFNGDLRTDFSVVRNTGGGPGGQVTWFINLNGSATTYGSAWGIASDFFVPEDYDGDGRTDIAIWRPGAPTVAAFYILQSATNTVRIDTFGQTGDDPSVVGDYDNDGKADPAVYRDGVNAGDPSTWFYRGSSNNPGANVTYVPWGQDGDFPAPGDYDGDGSRDFVIQRNNGGGQARFWMLQTTAGIDNSIVFGTPTDVIVPGDYDGDGKTDIAVVRSQAGALNWYVRPSSTGTITAAPFAIFGASATDFPTQGDYDGDGKTDVAIWRTSATAGASAFWAQTSASGTFAITFGQNGDYPVANYNTH